MTLSAAVLLAQTVSAQTRKTLEPVWLAAEWDDYTVHDPLFGHVLVTYAGIPPSRGTATVRFPHGGHLWAWRWQATASKPDHVLLVALAVLSTNGTVRQIHNDLLVHRTSRTPGQVHDTGLSSLPHPMKLYPGDLVFVGAYGWGGEHAASVLEVQTLLWVERGTVTEAISSR